MIHTFPKEDFIREARILKSLINDDVYKILQRLDVMVAGGAITSLFSNRDINDLDLYFRSWDDLEVFITYMHDNELRCGDHDLTPETNGWNKYKRAYRRFKTLDGESLKDIPFKIFIGEKTEKQKESELISRLSRLRAIGQRDAYDVEESDYIKPLGMTDKSVMFSNLSSPVMQCIGFDVFGSPQEIFDKFDFTINMGAFCFADESWHFDNNFLKHCSQKVLVLNPDTDYPIISMLRASKYQARGYTISRRETMKLGMSTSRLQVESWADAKKHLSGMYGTNVETLFNEDRPFSFDLLFDKLDSAGDKLISSIASEKEKGVENSSFSLTPVSCFMTLNTLRKNTGRPHIKTLWGVCRSKNFYLMEPENSSQRVHIGMTDIEDGFITYVDMFFDEEDARSKLETLSKDGGGVLLSLDVIRPETLDQEEYDRATPYRKKEKNGRSVAPTIPTVIIRKYIESNGDFT